MGKKQTALGRPDTTLPEVLELRRRREAATEAARDEFAALVYEQAALFEAEYQADVERWRQEETGMLHRRAGGPDMAFLRPVPRRRGGRPTRSKHPFPVRVGNVLQWALDHGISYATAKSWYADGKSLSPIPRAFQVLLERTYGIPASAWRGGITDNVQTVQPSRVRR